MSAVININIRGLILVCVALYLVLLFLIPRGSFDGHFWVQWMTAVQEKGFIEIYSAPETNRFPFTMYLYGLAAYIFKALQLNLQENVYLLKIPFLAADLANVVLCGLILARARKPIERSLLLLGNIALLYNTLLFGQTDSGWTFWLLLTIYLTITKHYRWAAISAALTFNTKLLASLHVLTVVLIWIVSVWRQHKKRWLMFAQGLTLALFTTLVVWMPFILAGKADSVINAVLTSGSVDLYPVLAQGAHNYWVFMEDKPSEVKDSVISSLNIAYKYVGLILFTGIALIATIAAIPLLLEKNIKDKLPMLFLWLGTGSLAFFYFATQMHERYAHFALVAFGIYAALSGRYVIYLLTSVAYLFNMEYVIRGDILKFLYESPIFTPQTAATLYALALIIALATLIFPVIKYARTQVFRTKVASLHYYN